MRKLIIAAALLISTQATAGTFTSHGPGGTISTHCTHSFYGTTCWTTINPQGNTARVIDVPEEMPNAAPSEPQMNDAQRAAARRESCKSRSVVCLPEPTW